MIKNKIMTIFFTLMICLAWTVPAYSGKKRINFSIGIQGSGLWVASDQMMRDVYGIPFYPFGFFFRAGIGENFALEASTDFIFESGTPLDTYGNPFPSSQASMNLNSINISGILGLSLDRDFSPYLGAGVSTCNVEETLSIYGYSETGSWNAVGFHFLIGFQKFWKNLGARSEVRYLTASVDGWQGKTNIGGFGLYFGVMFRFGI